MKLPHLKKKTQEGHPSLAVLCMLYFYICIHSSAPLVNEMKRGIVDQNCLPPIRRVITSAAEAAKLQRPWKVKVKAKVRAETKAGMKATATRAAITAIPA